MQEKNKNSTFEDSFRLLSDSLAEPMVVADEKCVIIEANEAFAKICGLKREELIGKNAEQLACLSEETKRILCNNLKKRLEGYSIEPYETEFLSRNGESKYFELTGKRIEYRGQPADLVILHNITQRRHLEERMEKTVNEKTIALAANEVTFNAVFESSPDAITILDLEGNIVKCNQATADLHGYLSAEELIGKSAFELISSNDHARTAILMQEMPKVGLKKNLEFTFVTRTGEEFLAEGSAAVIRDSAGNPAGFVSITKSIQERKETEKVLRESEEKYRNLVENSKDAIAIVDFKGNVLFANEAAERLTGYTLKEGKGMNIRAITPKRLWPKGIAMLLKARLGKVIPYFEYELKRKDGTIIPVETGGQAIFKDGKPVAVQIVTRDITELKKAQEELTRLSNALKMSSDSIVVSDLDGKIINVNEATLKMYGTDNEGELIGKSSFDLIVPKEREKALAGMKEVLEKGCITSQEYHVATKDGRKIPVEMSVAIMKDEKGKLIGFVAVSRDITERKNNEAKLRLSEEQFRQLFLSMPSGVAVYEAVDNGEDFVFKDFNTSAETIEKTSRENVIGKRVTQVFPGVKSFGLFEVFQRVWHSGQPEYYPAALYKDDEDPGTWRENWVYKLPNGFIVAIYNDITERKYAELALARSEEKFRVYIESSPVAVFIANPEGEYEYVNLAACMLLGYSKAELLEMSIPQVAFKQANQVNLDKFVEVNETGRSVSETALKAKDGLPVYVVLNSVKLPDGKLMAFCENVTQRRKAETALKDSEEKFRNLAEQSPNMIFIHQKGKVVYANKEAEKAIGYTKEEYYSSEFNFLDLIIPENRELVVSYFVKHMKGEDTAPYEYGLMTKDGKRIDAILNTKIITYNGEPAILGIATDITMRKLMQHALEESEEKFRTITNSVKDSIILVDDQTKVVYWNPAAIKTFGYTNTEAMGKKIHELVVPETISPAGREYIGTGVRQFARTGSGAFTDGNIELLGRRKDGTEFPAKISLTPIKLNGKWSAVGVVKDITEGKQAEQKLKEAEKRYHALFNEAPLGVLVIDPQTERAVEFNDIAHTQLGYSREEFSKLRLPDIAAISTVSEIRAHIAKIIREGRDEFEVKQRTKNGEIRNVLVNAKAVELAGQQFLFCVFHDITEIRKVQNALMESETKYRQLLNVAQEGIWAFDKNYQTIFVNPKMAQMLGCSERELAGKSIFEFLKKEHIEQASSFLGEFKKGFSGHFDYSFARKNGSCIDVSIIASVINDDEGKPVGTLAMVSDITDRKILERKVDNYSNHLKSMVELRTAQLKNANEQLVKSERLAAVGELAGMVGHDLRNPLTGIKNAAYYLKKKGTTISEVQAKEMLETIDKSIDHANSIITDLLDYSREMHLELTEYALATLLNDALRMIQVPDRIQIVNHVLGETLIKVEADKMMRVFINLIKNAIDAMPEKGTLEIKSRQTKESVEISFADTGTGISKETLQKLFAPLFTTKAQGMGFGLAICKRVVEAHRGTITVETEVNKGTTFTVTLPIKPKIEVGCEKTWVNMPESLLLTTTKT